MFVLIWATLLFSVGSSSANNTANNESISGGEKTCQNEPCSKLSEANLTAEAGCSVVIQCSFTAPAGFHVKSVIMYKCDEAKPKCGEPGTTIFNSSDNSTVQSEFKGWVSLLEPTLNQSNCSIIINGFNESDSGSYEIRILFIKDKENNCTPTSRANITTGSANPNQSGIPGWISDLLKQIAQEWKVITAFLFGMLLSATICCLARICCRKKQRKSEKLAENLEMVTTQAAPLIDGGQPMEDNDGSHDRESSVGGPEAAGQSAPGGDMEPKEVEYSDIDFSILKTKSPTEAEETQEPPETEYAEIKKEAPEEGQDGGGEEGEVLEEAMIGENRVTEECMPAKEKEGEDVALYSNMDEIMDQT